MPWSPLLETGYKPKLSGHETFALRYGWLKKAYDAVSRSAQGYNVFSDKAIVDFGVGKNMVSSIKHWAVAAGVVEKDDGKGHITTDIGELLFSDEGLDPYMEHPSTSWWVHWNLAGKPNKTTWFWTFNHCPAVIFNRDYIINSIVALAKDRNWSHAAQATIKNDVGCFINSYASHHSRSNNSYEDSLESPLTELGLIRSVGGSRDFSFVRDSKSTLGDGLFCYAVEKFWNSNFPDTNTLSLEALMHSPGSPGRVFMLSENSIMNRVANLESVSRSRFILSEAAGLQQLIRRKKFTDKAMRDLIKADFSSRRRVKQAA